MDESEKGNSADVEVEIYSYPPKKRRKSANSNGYLPNPNLLVINIDKENYITLNNEPYGNVYDSSKLENQLKNIFKERIQKKIWNADYSEIDREVVIQCNRTIKFGNFINVIEKIEKTGATPINLELKYIDHY